ncbi:MAG: hypothetical protein ABI811_13970 [Acidobacteriota bacterium]
MREASDYEIASLSLLRCVNTSAKQHPDKNIHTVRAIPKGDSQISVCWTMTMTPAKK